MCQCARVCFIFFHLYVRYWQALHSILHTHMNMHGLILIMTVQTCHWLIKQSDGCVCMLQMSTTQKQDNVDVKASSCFFFFSLFHIGLKFLHQFLCLSLILAIADIDKQINLTSRLWHFFFFSFSCIILSCFANDLFLKRVKQHDYRHVLSTPLADNNNLQCHLWPPTVSLSPLVPQ